MSTTNTHISGRGDRMSAALAALASMAISGMSTGHSQIVTLPTTPGTGRGRRFEIPADSRVRNLVNKEVRDWNDEIGRKKAERKGAKYMKASRR